VPRATYRLPRSFVGRFRRQRRDLLLPPALPGGRGKFLRRASPSFWAVRGWLPLGFSCGAAEHHHLLFSQHTGAGAAAQQHREQAPAASPRKKKHPGSPGRPVGGVARAAPGVAGGGRGGPSEAAVFAGTDASAVPPLLSVPVCRPHVYRAKLNTTASGKIYPGKCQQRAFYSQMEGATTSLIDGSVFAR
jgi:hypothetical protein